MTPLILLLALLLLAAADQHHHGEQPEAVKCVSGFCLTADYEKLETPVTDRVTIVNVTTDIMDVLTVNDKEFSVTLTMYFSVQWEEPRLVTNLTVEPGQWTPVDLKFLDELWVPNIFIYDLRSFTALDVLKKLAGVWIVEGSSVYYNQVRR